jgi:condensin complex subunit 1
MDVDDEEATDGDEEDDEANATPRRVKKEKKSKKSKPRKSELDMAALTSEQAALAALESNQLLHLRLRKKYYSEALSFIRTLENGMEDMERLLGSKNKLEVLEAIEFFRVAHEYQFDSAQVALNGLIVLVDQVLKHMYRKGSRGCYISSGRRTRTLPLRMARKLRE